MEKIDDGGPAFPTHFTLPMGPDNLPGVSVLQGMTLRDYFACHAPEPTQADISTIWESEKLANPHNDTYKPPRRSPREIVAALRYRWADDMLKAREQ